MTIRQKWHLLLLILADKWHYLAQKYRDSLTPWPYYHMYPYDGWKF